jgi:hypothetical protein
MTVVQPPVEICVPAPLREFLEWVARCPRTYAETMEAWGSHCPRFTIWEDALAAELVELAASDGSVQLTPHGQALLRRPAAAA